MNKDSLVSRWLTLAGLCLWAVIIVWPLGNLFCQVQPTSPAVETHGNSFLLRTFTIAFGIALIAVILGYCPGKLLARRSDRWPLLLLIFFLPLVLPRYVLYYAWSLLLNPTSTFGQFLTQHSQWARTTAFAISIMVLVLWYWPIAALLIAQGFRQIDRDLFDSARLDSAPINVFRNITLPLLKGPLLLAFLVCFVLSLSEFSTFHLAGFETLGTYLAFLYQLTGSEAALLRAAWPIAVVALIVALLLSFKLQNSFNSSITGDAEQHPIGRWNLLVLFVLAGLSFIAPLGLLIANLSETQTFQNFLPLHSDELAWSLLIATITALLSHGIAYGAITLRRFNRPGCWLSLIVQVSLFLAMFLPASLVAVSLLSICNRFEWTAGIGQSWLIVALGQTARFAGVALLLMLLVHHSRSQLLTEAARLDGAGSWSIWWRIHFPRSWPVFLGSFLLIGMLSMTELSATMVLLPAGLPSFAQRLLNQMHYARDQQVIASCLLLVSLFFVLAFLLVCVLRLCLHRGIKGVLFIFVCLLAIGCERTASDSTEPKVLNCFGQTGKGQGEFMYPRACDYSPEQGLWVIDKAGRFQRFSSDGIFQAEFKMPKIESGKPTGFTIGPDQRLYVADTHYHRVIIFSPAGNYLEEFGSFGQGDGEFIYPTDVAFAPDGRIYVSEYGGNDRVSVFDAEKNFLFSFGSPGSLPQQFSRPSALCVDQKNNCLYVADACNHRLAVYDFDGHLTATIGSLGRQPGQLRYPYDLALLDDGTIVVCEYGNNRIQLFDPEGKSRAIYGQPGRQPGQLAYPWAVAVDTQRRAFIIDAGNNRVQLWQL